MNHTIGGVFFPGGGGGGVYTSAAHQIKRDIKRTTVSLFVSEKEEEEDAV